MDNEFKVEILSFLKIAEIENAWTASDYTELLGVMNIGEEELAGLNTAQLKDMCLMSLNDFEHHESAKFLLTHIFKDEMAEGEVTEGKLEQTSHHMVEHKLWEEHANPAYHQRFFNAYGLLRQAYNGIFAEPTGVQFTVNISADKAEAFDIFEQSLHAVLVRLISRGISESAILNRLFEAQISGDQFPTASKILWELKEVSHTDKARQYEITSSSFWFGELEHTNHFEATAHADGQAE